MVQTARRTGSVSDPNSPDYDPNSPHYDVTADSSSRFYVGPPAGDHPSGDEIRAEVTDTINQAAGPAGGFLDQVLGPIKDDLIQDIYHDRLKDARRELGDDMALREPGEPPRTLWANASHEQMVEIIHSNADSATVADASEEWVRLGNELSHHQRAFGKAINDSLGNWQGDAGDSARTHLADVAKWLGSTAEGTVLSGRQQEIHSQALNETQKAMTDNPPVPFSAPEANARLARIVDPIHYAMQFSAEMDTYHRHQAARDQAAQVMQRFDESVAGAVTTPKFPAPPALLRATQQRDSLTRRMAEEPSVTRNAAPEGMFTADQAVMSANGAGPGGAVPGGAVPGGSVPGGSVPGGGAPGGTVPGGSVPGGSGVPGNSGLPGGVGAPAAAFSGGGLPGGGGAPGTPSIPPMPDFNLASNTAPSGVTAPSGLTPPASIPGPNLPDVPRGLTVPNATTGGGPANLPGPGYTPPTFSTPRGPDGESTRRLPVTPRNRPNIPGMPNMPGTGPDGRGIGPGMPPRFGGQGQLPGMPSTPGGGPSGGGAPGSAPGGGPGGAPPGARGGFGPVGGGGSVGAVPGGGAPGGPGAPGAPGGGAAGARGQAGAPAGGGMGGGAGGQGGDEEYQVASYLEGDSELFAPGKVVSPPVIGDWQGKQDWK